MKKEKLIERSIRPEAAFNKVYRNYTNRCQTYDFDFKLTTDEFFCLTQQECFYCGSLPSRISKAWSDKIKPFVYNGVDRVNNDLGYTKDNCVSCCSRCNYAKGDMDLVSYKEWLSKSYHHIFKSGEENE